MTLGGDRAMELKIRDTYRVVSGKNIKCGACGACCTIYSKVDLHVTDIFRISERLGMSPKAFFDRYCKVIAGEDSSTFMLNVEGGCEFRSDGGCAIYEVRPEMCAFYPSSYTCLNLSQNLKAEMAPNPACSVHTLADGLILVPDIERMVDSRIFFMVKEMYLARFGSQFNEGGAEAFHKSGLAQVQNTRIREMIRRQVLDEILQNVPVDGVTKAPLLSGDEIATILKM